MPQQEQNAQSHASRDPLHMAAFLILFINLIFVTYAAVRVDLFRFTWQTILFVAVAVAFLIVALKARTNAIKVQDRVIRLEERLRYAALLSPSQLQSAQALTIKQIVALRFASDPELPTLLDRAVAENLLPKQIKAAIQTWRPDTERV